MVIGTSTPFLILVLVSGSFFSFFRTQELVLIDDHAGKLNVLRQVVCVVPTHGMKIFLKLMVQKNNPA
jgi:hypothetical protein